MSTFYASENFNRFSVVVYSTGTLLTVRQHRKLLCFNVISTIFVGVADGRAVRPTETMLRPPKDRCTQTVYPWADEGVRPYRALPKVSTGTAYLPAGASCHRRILVRGGSPFAPALARSPRRRVFWDSRVRLVLFLMQGISRLTLEMTSCSLGFIMSFRFGYNARARSAGSKTGFCCKLSVA